MEFKIDEVIAERSLRHDGTTVRVLLGRPAPMPEGPDFYCPYRIEGLAAGDLEFFAAGIDSVQALTLALAMVGARLESEAGGAFEHDGGPGTGFPTLSTVDDTTAELSLRLATA
jgi:hypothetical protein